MDLSIIIVTYNGLDITLQTLAAYHQAIAADEGHQYELIVVDNASPEGVAEAIAQEYPAVTVIANQENYGFSKANNIGYVASQGRYLLFSNPDIEVNAKIGVTQLLIMRRRPGGLGGSSPHISPLLRTLNAQVRKSYISSCTKTAYEK
jgi:GT2 family glycosyltransferase